MFEISLPLCSESILTVVLFVVKQKRNLNTLASNSYSDRGVYPLLKQNCDQGAFSIWQTLYLNAVHLDTNDRTKNNFSTSIYEDFKGI